MSTEFTPLHDGFDSLAAQITEPGPIDIDRAVAAGRRARARRRTATAGVAAIGVAATAALGLAAADIGTAPDPARPVAVPSASPSSEAARASSDPITLGASFGWLPTGWIADGYSFAPPGTQASHGVAYIEAQTGEPDSPVLTLGDAPAGARPTLDLSVSPAKAPVFTPGPSINGHKSFLETYPGFDSSLDSDDSYYLTWQLDDGSWATLNVLRSHGLPTTADILHVAEAVTDKPSPIPQPYQIDGPLADAEVVDATMQSAITGELTMRAGAAEIDITLATKEKTGLACKGGPLPNRFVCVAVHGTLPAPLASAGIQGILDDITLLEFSTTDVIRREP